MGSRGLGINKDLEPLVRRVRREGGAVEVTTSTHVRWTMPDGSVLTSGLTMSSTSARRTQRDVESALARCAGVPVRQDVAGQFTVEPDARGKFLIVNTKTGEALRNSNGYVRTFSSLTLAQDARRAHVAALLKQG